MMTPRVTNNDIILHDEEFNGQEVEAAALPPPTEMAANHPEEEEPDEPEPTSRRTNRYRFSRNQALAALAATVALVGTGTVVSRAASGKTTTSIDSSMQAANVPQPQDLGYESGVTGTVGSNMQMQAANVVPVDVRGYEVVGSGGCLDGSDNYFPWVRYYSANGIPNVKKCGAKCLKCVRTAFPSQFVGFYHNPQDENCICAVSQPIGGGDFDQFDSGKCNTPASNTWPTNPGTGPIAKTFTAAGYTCYRFVGGDRKSVV